MAMLAYSIAASAAAAADAPGTPLSRRDAGRAGRASTTASARISSGSAADPTTSRHPVAVRVSSRTVARVRTVAPEAAGHRRGQRAQPVGQRGEHGRAGGRVRPGPCRRRRRYQGPHRLGQRPVRPGGRSQRAQRGLERQLLRPPGVDPAEQRVDQPVHQLRPEPGPDVGGHRHVAVARGGGQLEVLPGPGQPGGRQHPAGGQPVQVRGHAHELPRRERVQGAPAPDGRGRGAGQHQPVPQPDRADQVGALRPARAAAPRRPRPPRPRPPRRRSASRPAAATPPAR